MHVPEVVVAKAEVMGTGATVAVAVTVVVAVTVIVTVVGGSVVAQGLKKGARKNHWCVVVVKYSNGYITMCITMAMAMFIAMAIAMFMARKAAAEMAVSGMIRKPSRSQRRFPFFDSLPSDFEAGFQPTTGGLGSGGS